MNMRTTFAVVIAATSSFIECHADEELCPPSKTVESPDLYFRYEGATEPDKIPDHRKYRVFVMKYNVYLDELVQKLSTQDHAVLHNLKISEDGARVTDNDLYGQAFLNLCATSIHMDAVTYAKEAKRIADESNDRFVLRVEQAFASLSSNGRQLVEQYIAEEITPSQSHQIKTIVDYAIEDPEQILFHRELTCHQQMTGELHPILKRTMECAQQRMQTTGGNDGSAGAVLLGPQPEVNQ